MVITTTVREQLLALLNPLKHCNNSTQVSVWGIRESTSTTARQAASTIHTGSSTRTRYTYYLVEDVLIGCTPNVHTECRGYNTTYLQVTKPRSTATTPCLLARREGGVWASPHPSAGCSMQHMPIQQVALNLCSLGGQPFGDIARRTHEGLRQAPHAELPTPPASGQRDRRRGLVLLLHGQRRGVRRHRAHSAR